MQPLRLSLAKLAAVCFGGVVTLGHQRQQANASLLSNFALVEFGQPQRFYHCFYPSARGLKVADFRYFFFFFFLVFFAGAAMPKPIPSGVLLAFAALLRTSIGSRVAKF